MNIARMTPCTTSTLALMFRGFTCYIPTPSAITVGTPTRSGWIGMLPKKFPHHNRPLSRLLGLAQPSQKCALFNKNMPTLKGFTTTQPILPQFKAAGIEIKLPFKAEEALKVTQNPFENNDVVNCDHEDQIIEKITE